MALRWPNIDRFLRNPSLPSISITTLPISALLPQFNSNPTSPLPHHFPDPLPPCHFCFHLPSLLPSRCIPPATISVLMVLFSFSPFFLVLFLFFIYCVLSMFLLRWTDCFWLSARLTLCLLMRCIIALLSEQLYVFFCHMYFSVC